MNFKVSVMEGDSSQEVKVHSAALCCTHRRTWSGHCFLLKISLETTTAEHKYPERPHVLLYIRVQTNDTVEFMDPVIQCSVKHKKHLFKHVTALVLNCHVFDPLNKCKINAVLYFCELCILMSVSSEP